MNVKSLYKAIKNLKLPTTSDYAMKTSGGKVKYREAWGQLETDAREMVHTIVRMRAAKQSPDIDRVLKKLEKHLEKCQILGAERYDSWIAAEEMATSRQNVGLLQCLWEIFTDDKERQRAEDRKMREMDVNSKKAEKTYFTLLREREKLLVEMETVGKLKGL